MATIAHTPDAIVASLDSKLRVINYQLLNVDKPGLKQIMDLAVEGSILQKPINIDVFADDRFGTAPSKVSKAQLNTTIPSDDNSQQVRESPGRD